MRAVADAAAPRDASRAANGRTRSETLEQRERETKAKSIEEAARARKPRRQGRETGPSPRRRSRRGDKRRGMPRPARNPKNAIETRPPRRHQCVMAQAQGERRARRLGGKRNACRVGEWTKGGTVRVGREGAEQNSRRGVAVAKQRAGVSTRISGRWTVRSKAIGIARDEPPRGLPPLERGRQRGFIVFFFCALIAVSSSSQPTVCAPMQFERAQSAFQCRTSRYP